jgi:hypothetical protein
MSLVFLVRSVCRSLAFALLALAPGIAGTAQADEDLGPSGLHIIRFDMDYWPTVRDLKPDRSAFTPPFGGDVQSLGYGAHVAYMHRAGRTLGARAYAGGEFAGDLNGSGRRYAGIDAASGQTVQAEMFANIGYFAPCGRLVWPKRRWEWHVSGGAGLYLMRAKDNIQGVGFVDTDVHDATFGGYVGLGAGRMLRRGPMWLELESRVHAFDFRHLRPGFPGQRVGGPLVEVAAAVDWAL